MNAKKAFTLIELLVVIAIIAILAAILFPVFAQAKLAAKKTVAVSGVKQIALGQIMYQGDYDDVLPMAQSYGAFNTNMAIELGPYIQKVANNYQGETGTNTGDNIWHDPGDPTSSKQHASFVPIYWTSYTGRAAWDTFLPGINSSSGYVPGRSSSEFLAPADTFVLAESALTTNLLGQNFGAIKRPWDPVTSTWPGNAGANPGGAYAGQDCKTTNASGVCTQLLNSAMPSGFYQDGWVYAYEDGHAKYLKVLATIGKGVGGNGKDKNGATCSGFTPCGAWTLDDQD